MSALAPTVQAWFTEHLLTQRQASPRTVAAYRDTLRMLLAFAQARTGKAPSQLDVADVDAALIAAFLTHLEQERHNSARTRNARLAAVRSLYRHAALRHPEHAQLIQRVLAIPGKRHDRSDVSFLQPEEADALLAAPDRSTWTGRRDHALLVLAVQTGLRVSELTGLCCGDIQLGSGPHVRCTGKGRKDRATPLTAHTVAVLREWMKERAASSAGPLFVTSRGGPLSTDAVQWLVAKYAVTAAKECPSIAAKTVSAHALRHTCAMNLLHSGVDVAVIALCWGTKVPRRRQRSTCTPTCRSRSRPWRAPHHPTPDLAATVLVTRFSPSSRACDYAEPIRAAHGRQQAERSPSAARSA
jgi:integrase/recombinase XerD